MLTAGRGDPPRRGQRRGSGSDEGGNPLAIGSELVSGAVPRHQRPVARARVPGRPRLRRSGSITTVGDDLAENVDVLRIAAGRAGLDFVMHRRRPRPHPGRPDPRGPRRPGRASPWSSTPNPSRQSVDDVRPPQPRSWPIATGSRPCSRPGCDFGPAQPPSAPLRGSAMEHPRHDPRLPARRAVREMKIDARGAGHPAAPRHSAGRDPRDRPPQAQPLRQGRIRVRGRGDGPHRPRPRARGRHHRLRRHHQPSASSAEAPTEAEALRRSSNPPSPPSTRPLRRPGRRRGRRGRGPRPDPPSSEADQLGRSPPPSPAPAAWSPSA